MIVEKDTDTNGQREHVGDESGQVMILVIGYVILTLMVLTVVMAISAVYLEHKKLLSVADSASLAASDNFGVGEVQDGTRGPAPALTKTSVQAAAAKYISDTGAAARFNELSISGQTGAPEGRTAHVVLTAVVHPPIVNYLVPAGIDIVVVSEARPQLGR
ncbi:pilus assembly protein TadG-related protein [Arthrobacter roseus]|uniref:pilus assembly protein TadG-related protein n=1 Tax=Arthrobacter roseus TaxID=136274 RepID=UPI001965C9C1|nr:pilus assembly protein TadG-related protein [Arthrobacter roseus]MBM7849074.1 putative membrane protein [Arthrobacter roseus]